MHEVTAIVGPGQGIGFSLAGVRVQEAATREEVIALLEDGLGDERSGVILIDESLKEGLPDPLMKRIDESTVPLVVGVPVISKWEYVHTSDEVFANIIHRAIGYRVRI